LGSRFPFLGQFRAGGTDNSLRLLQFTVQQDQGIVRRLHGVQFTAALFQIGDHVLHSGAIFLFQAVKLVSPGLRGVQLRGRKGKFCPFIPNRLGKVIYFTANGFQPFV